MMNKKDDALRVAGTYLLHCSILIKDPASELKAQCLDLANMCYEALPNQNRLTEEDLAKIMTIYADRDIDHAIPKILLRSKIKPQTRTCNICGNKIIISGANSKTLKNIERYECIHFCSQHCQDTYLNLKIMKNKKAAEE
jgi:hypothetical protein